MELSKEEMREIAKVPIETRRYIANLESQNTALLEALEAFVWAQDASDRNTGPRWNIQFLDEANTKAIAAIHKTKEKDDDEQDA